MAADHIVYVVDDDERIREALLELLALADFNAVAFDSAEQYMSAARPDLPACLLLDLELPDINGLDLQARIAGAQHPPIVFITGHADVPSSVRALKAGAIDFLLKPLHTGQLVEATRAALERDRQTRQRRAQLEQLSERYRTLTPREREVLPLVVAGRLNKQAAAELGISEVTLQIHRSRILKKMRADSVAELVRVALALGLPLPVGATQ